MSIEAFRKLALAFPQVTEAPHFDKTSFRIHGKIFATLSIPKQQAMVKLSVIDQDVFSAFDNSIIFPVPNKWGKQGCTFINLQNVREDILTDALSCAFCNVAPRKIIEGFEREETAGEKGQKSKKPPDTRQKSYRF